MTQYGEIMPGSSDSKSDIVWIVPVCRLPKELGRKLVWGTDNLALVGQDGKGYHPVAARWSPIHGLG
eukprot:12434123-Prorocentrum_lima.AAC.1